ncbi:hypothetical protein [Paenibacillus aceti]|uniref:Uncharacterized protein n=1 Tax=Paenibacillus aceti TaxID=1820010 RepID=A0ABQ1VPG4_9BACL|nr:hypothetical protein [Paenibacillus aceti]GGF87003.1 hypothetical protein GCM10010913_05600 [Paenibacillus aceti]
MIYNILKRFGSVMVVLGILFGIFILVSGQPIETVIIVVVSALSGGLFFIGFGSLIESVHKIQVHLTGEQEESSQKRAINTKPHEKTLGVKD